MMPKFRAWDKENNRMIYPNTTGVCFELSDEGIMVLDVDVDYPEDHAFPKIDSVLMQSTGLTDKNGVEIYCDDVLTDGKSKRMVIWREDDSQIQLSVDDDAYESRIKLSQQLIDIFGLTICGNIHGNAELLEGE